MLNKQRRRGTRHGSGIVGGKPFISTKSVDRDEPLDSEVTKIGVIEKQHHRCPETFGWAPP